MYSFAAGRRAKANHPGSFVWGDSTDADVASTANDQFLVRAAGGVTFRAGTAVLRIEPHPDSPNMIGGYSGNVVDAGRYGATIGGGGVWEQVCGDGDDPCWHRVQGLMDTIGGGEANTATSDYATIGGGASNTADFLATIGGGTHNTAAGSRATIGGGEVNTATGYAASVGGGYYNSATGNRATIPGGMENTAAGAFSLAAGRQAQANHDGSFVWADGIGVPFGSMGNNQFRACGRPADSSSSQTPPRRAARPSRQTVSRGPRAAIATSRRTSSPSTAARC